MVTGTFRGYFINGHGNVPEILQQWPSIVPDNRPKIKISVVL